MGSISRLAWEAIDIALAKTAGIPTTPYLAKLRVLKGASINFISRNILTCLWYTFHYNSSVGFLMFLSSHNSSLFLGSITGIQWWIGFYYFKIINLVNNRHPIMGGGFIG